MTAPCPWGTRRVDLLTLSARKRRSIWGREPRVIKKRCRRKNLRSWILWKNPKSQGRASLQEEVTNIAMARKIFTLQTKHRSIFSSLTEACTLQLHALQMPDRQRRSTQSTDKASWNHIDRHWQTHALREPSGNQAEVRSPNHMNLYKLCAGCKLGVTWVAHTPPHALLHQL